MRSICLAIMTVVLSVLTAGAPASAAEITGKGFPLHNAQFAQMPVKQTITTTKIIPAPAAGTQTATASPSTLKASSEEGPVLFPTPERRRSRTGEARELRLPSMFPALLAVVVVCGIFCVILYLVKKYLPGHRQMFAHPAMEFLGRTHLDQRRFVSLLRVGKRIIVVGVTPDEMNTLSEITDEAEVTEIMEVARPKTETGLTMFQKLFQRNVIDVEAAEAKAEAQAKAAELDEQMSAIRERVKSITKDESRKPASAPTARRFDAVG